MIPLPPNATEFIADYLYRGTRYFITINAASEEDARHRQPAIRRTLRIRPRGISSEKDR